MSDDLRKICGGASTRPADFDPVSESVRVEDCNGDGSVGEADRIYVREDSEGKWLSPKEFQAYLEERHLIPKGMPVAGKGVAALQGYANSIYKARKESLESPGRHWRVSEYQTDIVSYLDMALAYAQEMGLTMGSPELRGFVSDFAARAIEAKCAAIEEDGSITSMSFLLSTLQRMSSGFPTIAAISSDDRWLGAVKRTGEAARKALERLPQLVGREPRHGAEAVEAAYACAAILQISPEEALRPVKEAWKASTKEQIAKNRESYLANGGYDDSFFGKGRYDRRRVTEILTMFDDANRLGVDLGLPEVRRWAEDMQAKHESSEVRMAMKKVRRFVKGDPIGITTAITDFLKLPGEAAAPQLKEEFAVLAHEALPPLIRYCLMNLKDAIAKNYVAEYISEMTSKVGQLFEVAAAHGVSSPEIDALIEDLIDTTGRYLTPKIDGGEHGNFYDALSAVKGKGPALYKKMIASHGARWGKLFVESYDRLIDGAAAALGAGDADLTGDLYSMAGEGTTRARALSIIGEPEGKALHTRLSDLKARLWGAQETGGATEVAGKEWTKKDFKAARALALKYWRTLKSYPDFVGGGINLVYGPVLDVGGPDSYMYKANRSHTEDPAVAALLGILTMAKSTAVARGTIFVHKHAPGIGALPNNPEWTGKVIVDPRTEARIEADFQSFKLALEFAPERSAVMIGGAAYPALEGDGAVRPAMFSSTVVEWVRSRVPKSTVLITDDLGTETLRTYIRNTHPEVGEDERLFIKQAVLDAVKAGSDLMLFYGKTRKAVEEVREVAIELVAEGKVGREELEASVRRILVLKRQAYPGHPLLADVDGTVAKMSVEELWMQKLALPAWEATHSRWLAASGAGAIAFEGVRRGPTIQADLQAWIGEHPDNIPPLLANNSPQESSSRESSINAVRMSEIDAMRAFAEEAKRRFPKGMPKEAMWAIVRSIADTPKMASSDR